MRVEIKERPILFSGAMVRAILEGRKTVTRRALKPLRHTCTRGLSAAELGSLIRGEGGAWLCPYGQPGDRLWVREAWAADAQVDAVAPRDLSQGEPILYPSDGAIRQTGCALVSPGKGRPSIHMPRWASRILLEITSVRVERLQDISEEQSRAEGVQPSEHCIGPLGTKAWAVRCQHCGMRRREHIGVAMVCRGRNGDCWNGNTAKGGFGMLWESINGIGSWAANPWVWVVEFKRVEVAHG